MLKFLLIIYLTFMGCYSNGFESRKELQFLCNTPLEVDTIISQEQSKLETGLGNDQWELSYQIYKIDFENNTVEQIEWEGEI